MKNRLFILLLLIFFVSTPIFSQQEEKPKEPEEMAADEAERLEAMLELEPHQVFYVDSILQHDMRAMRDEMEAMKRSGMQEYSSYNTVRERWIAQIEKGYKEIFTEDQWIHYLKSTGKFKKDKKSKDKKSKGKKERK
jgi:hypothetical protein